ARPRPGAVRPPAPPPASESGGPPPRGPEHPGTATAPSRKDSDATVVGPCSQAGISEHVTAANRLRSSGGAEGRSPPRPAALRLAPSVRPGPPVSDTCQTSGLTGERLPEHNRTKSGTKP